MSIASIPLGGVPLPPGITPPPTPPGPEINPDQPNSNGDVTITSTQTTSSSTESSSTSTSSTNAFPTVDLIGEPPPSNYQELIKIEPLGPLPADPLPEEETAPKDPPQDPSIDAHVGNVECFPQHGSTDADKIVSIAVTDDIIDRFCMGTEPNWQRFGPSDIPARYNHYDATFTLASSAPELCRLLYTEQGKENADVQNACRSPIKAITHQCVWNGGRVTSDCGEWTLQSCPNGGKCAIGEPGKHCSVGPPRWDCV